MVTGSLINRTTLTFLIRSAGGAYCCTFPLVILPQASKPGAVVVILNKNTALARWLASDADDHIARGCACCCQVGYLVTCEANAARSFSRRFDGDGEFSKCVSRGAASKYRRTARGSKYRGRLRLVSGRAANHGLERSRSVWSGRSVFVFLAASTRLVACNGPRVSRTGTYAIRPPFA